MPSPHNRGIQRPEKRLSVGLKSPFTAALWSHPESRASAQTHNLYKNQGISVVDYHCLYFIFFTFKTLVWMKWHFSKSKNLLSMTLLTSTELLLRAMSNDDYNPHLSYKGLAFENSVNLLHRFLTCIHQSFQEMMPCQRWSLKSKANCVVSQDQHSYCLSLTFLYHINLFSSTNSSYFFLIIIWCLPRGYYLTKIPLQENPQADTGR